MVPYDVVMEVQSDTIKRKPCSLASEIVRKGFLVGESGFEKIFKWTTISDFPRSSSCTKKTSLAAHTFNPDTTLSGKTNHCAFKMNLIDHVVNKLRQFEYSQMFLKKYL